MSIAPEPAETATSVIRVQGARTHNLKDVDLDLPRNSLIVFCGASGSGKTSMAIDTLYAEGQRRYIESFSAYTRQFLEQLDKPDCERIDGLPPAIAVTRASGSRSNRATVATATEVADHLRVLFARVGMIVCPECQIEVRRDTVDTIVDALRGLAEGERAMLGFEAPLGEQPAARVAELIEAGYVRALVGDEVVALADLAHGATVPERITVVVDRFVGGRVDADRLGESVETAIAGGEGACVVVTPGADASGSPVPPPPVPRTRSFDTRLRCNGCAREFAAPEPPLFNFNSPLGACPECEGFGSVVETDMDLVVPDKSLSLKQGAVAPWRTPAYEHELKELLELAPDYGIDVDAPYAELPPEVVRMVIEGVPERDFGGLNGFIQWLERRKYKMHLRVFLSRWRSYRPCPACGGDRLRPEALAVRVGGKHFAELCRLEVRDAVRWFEALPLEGADAEIARAVLTDVTARLNYLAEVGVGYLTLDRTLRTLSTGEAQRVAMTATLGSNLVDMLYVLDEPSTGLHPVDVAPLVGALRRLRDRGNTVIVVEHEEEAIRAADHAVEFGPLAGVEGGEIVFEGPPDQLVNEKQSRTGDWLSGRRMVYRTAENRRSPQQGKLTLLGATGANLGGEGRADAGNAGLDVEFPLGVLTVMTGVSGAGKSSLVRRTLFPALNDRLHDGNGSAEARHEADRPLPYVDLLGWKQLDDVVFVDQSPISRSPRSNPVTYVKAMDPIRALFADLPDAKARGYTASHFSFNVDGGRCEACQGAGHVEVDMQFLADITMRCRECDGRRYRDEVLDVHYRDRDIAEVLQMTVHEAIRFFRGETKIQQRLRPLIDVGLDYLQLGQPASTLSGGEAQRLKLAGRLATKSAGRTLFLLDEPTTGLHFSDVEQLVDCFNALVDVGHSLIVIEHNVPMMMAADWLIDLGPGAAADGGRVVAQGTPESVAQCAESATGRVLAEALARRDAAIAALEAEEEELEEDEV
ncbi:UvrABC system protein A [Botrimarina colliarenosi]|uniref:UvrABC system protein A n=1 Tax=Botrimarina colliarenosi TaxID=2528001 RepID=A0A5C6AAI7_9BACT|nr:excinuclease ABC subunit UvrA [Botrimarina colliarenosi]TWT97044.1 UvrABC system protein A [Botrimarina colliarenosi]